MILIPLSVIYNYNPKSDHVISSTFIYIHIATSIFCHFHENKVQAVSQQISCVKLCPVQQVILLKSSNLFIHFVKLSFLNVFHLPLFWMFFTLFLFPSFFAMSRISGKSFSCYVRSYHKFNSLFTSSLSLSHTFFLSLKLSLCLSHFLFLPLYLCSSVRLPACLLVYPSVHLS